MNLKEVGLVLGGLVLGGILGASLNGSKLQGRLSACQDMTSVLNQQLPLQLQCEIFKGDVYITSLLEPGFKVSLNGKDIVR